VAWVIGLTGDVGAGKSRVLAWLAGRGVATLDADAVVHDLLAHDRVLVAQVAERFDGAVVEGRVDRAALGWTVFADPAALLDLERLVHPRVTDRLRRWLAEQSGPAAIEAVKLVEGGLTRWVDAVWLVVAARSVRRARLRSRGWTEAEIERRLAAGSPLAARLAVADVVVDNSGTWAATERQLAAAWAGAARGGRDARVG
jgi:dephospho-CoA kinase